MPITVIFCCILSLVTGVSACKTPEHKNKHSSKERALAPAKLPTAYRLDSRSAHASCRIIVERRGVWVNGQQRLHLLQGSIPSRTATLNLQAPKRQTSAVASFAIDVSIPYSTWVWVVRQAVRAGYRIGFFAARDHEKVTRTGYIAWKDFAVIDNLDAPLADNTGRPPWSEVLSKWDRIHHICEQAKGVCTSRHPNPAQGGYADMVIELVQDTVSIRFDQIEAPEFIREKHQVRSLRFDSNSDNDDKAEVVTLERKVSQKRYDKDPADAQSRRQASFAFRRSQIMNTHSAITDILAMICGRQPCVSTFAAHADTPSGIAVATLTAAYASGSSSPRWQFAVIP